MKQNQHVVVGRIGKSHGVHGWMRVQSFTEPPEQLLHYQPWYWDSNAKEPIAVTEQVQKGNHLLIKLVDCKDPETVRERYTNRDIIMLRDQLPDTEEDEYYWQDLVGCSVQHQNGTMLGTVDHLFRTPGNDVIVVQQAKKKHLIPWTKDAVLTINMTQRCITVDWDSEL